MTWRAGLLVLWTLGGCGASRQEPAAAANGQAKATAPAASTPPPASDADSDHFSSVAAGVSIRKLPHWTFMPFEMELANREAISVGKSETDQAMHDASTPPLVVIARYPEPSDKPNPTLKINWRKLGELKGASPLDITRAVVEVMEKAIPSFELDAPVQMTRVSGVEAGTFRAHFTLVVPRSGSSFFVRTVCWIVPRGEYGLIFAASDPSGGGESFEADFQTMMATVTIRK